MRSLGGGPRVFPAVSSRPLTAGDSVTDTCIPVACATSAACLRWNRWVRVRTVSTALEQFASPAAAGRRCWGSFSPNSGWHPRQACVCAVGLHFTLAWLQRTAAFHMLIRILGSLFLYPCLLLFPTHGFARGPYILDTDAFSVVWIRRTHSPRCSRLVTVSLAVRTVLFL